MLVNEGKMLKWIIHSKLQLEKHPDRIYRVLLKQIKCDNDVSHVQHSHLQNVSNCNIKLCLMEFTASLELIDFT